MDRSQQLKYISENKGLFAPEEGKFLAATEFNAEENLNLSGDEFQKLTV